MMNKENLKSSSRTTKRFIYHLGYLVISELKSILRQRDIGVKLVILKREAESALLVRHQYKGKNLWYLPGGGVQIGEGPDEAIRREITEEIIIDTGEPVLAGIYKSGEKKGNITFLFCCYGRETVKIAPNSEIEESQFFPLTDLPENLAPGVKERINEVLEKIKDDIFRSPGITWGEW